MAEQLENLLQKIQDEAVTKADETAKQKMNEVEKTLLWSFWRRRHQAIAKYYHY